MNTHFSVATHILAFLHLQPGKAISSEVLAASINTNPGFVRRLLSQLRQAGLTRSTMGINGGTSLARPGAAITLLDVYRATGSAGQVFTPHAQPNPACPVGQNIMAALGPRFEAAEAALQTHLAGVTIAAVAEDIQGGMGATKAAHI